jgi:hypothetical protein
LAAVQWPHGKDTSCAFIQHICMKGPLEPAINLIIVGCHGCCKLCSCLLARECGLGGHCSRHGVLEGVTDATGRLHPAVAWALPLHHLHAAQVLMVQVVAAAAQGGSSAVGSRCTIHMEGHMSEARYFHLGSDCMPEWPWPQSSVDQSMKFFI